MSGMFQRFWSWFWPIPTPAASSRLSEHHQASERWRAINAHARAEGCPCGEPATEVRYDPRVAGSVPAETWTCIDCKDRTMWVTPDGRIRLASLGPGEPVTVVFKSSPAARATMESDQHHYPKETTP